MLKERRPVRRPVLRRPVGRQGGAHHHRVYLAASTLVGLLLVACGGGASVDSTEAPTPLSGATTPVSGATKDEGPTSAPTDLGQLRVGLSIPVMAFAPFYWAQTAGTWDDLGLEVEVIEFNAPKDGIQAFVGGAVDVASGGLNGAIGLINQGHDARVFWAGMNAADLAWWGQPDVAGLADVQGGTFGVSSIGGLDNLLLEFALADAGFDPKEDFEYFPVGPTSASLAALRAGELDATFLSPPTKYMAEDEGFTELIVQSEVLDPEYPKEVVYATVEVINEQHDELVALTVGLSEAISWARSNPDAAVDSLMDRFDVERPYAERAYTELMPTFHEDGRLPDDDAMTVFWDAMVSSGDIDEPWELERWWSEEIRSARGLS